MRISALLFPFLLLFFITACEPTAKKETIEPPKVEEPANQTDTTPAATIQTDTTPAPVTQSKKSVAPPPAYQFRYDLSAPDKTFKLSKKLIEISGISLSPDGQHLIAVNDEQGKIFYLNKENGKIEKEVKFGPNGDYEGIETVGEKIYVVRNNGDIFRVKNLDDEKPKTKEYNTDLNSNYDVEGLGYDEINNWLLLACKGKAGEKKDMKGKRAVYAFDLEDNKLKKQPVYIIDRNEIGEHFKSEGFSQGLVNAVSPDHASDAFAPSGIAIDPKTSDICLVSSVGKLFIVLSPIGPIKYMQKLESSLFKQPEGICFDGEGHLYISSEGRNGRAKIFRFSPN